VRRADRLFEILLLLRGGKRAVTGREIAGRFEISLRTVYRDMQDLIVAGMPIDGEAGVGYRLKPGADLPPLMFQEEELEALQLGAAMVRAWADPRLARAASSALDRIDAVLPERLRDRPARRHLFVPDFFIDETMKEHALQLRSAIQSGVQARIEYARDGEAPTERVIEPLGLFFWGAKWTLGAWCTLRQDFRTFRLDRIRSAAVLPDTACEHTLEEYRALDR
jgi:predicted DNA-binding transcriptional regulator YafY